MTLRDSFSIALTALLLLVGTLSAAESKKPNIVVFLADDLGYGETGYNGHFYVKTPNIDSIVRNGVRCLAGYTAQPVCMPSRAGLITGRCPTRFGVEFNSSKGFCGLPTSEVTIADHLRKLGYATGIFGKWHLGESEPCWYATSRGFDMYFGTMEDSPYFKPIRLRDSRRPIYKSAQSDWKEPELPADFYLTTACAQRAVEWMRSEPDRPLFLYMPFVAPHDPLEAPQSYLDRFNYLEEPYRTFCATMGALDDSVGMVLNELKASGRYDNTLVFFTSDNGGPHEGPKMPMQLYGRNTPFRGSKGLMTEGGIRVPFAVQWPGVFKPDTLYQNPVSTLDILPTAVMAAGGTAEQLKTVDGVDLRPFLAGEISDWPHPVLCWRMGDQFAIRSGDWKLVASGHPGEPIQTGLYNLKNDIREEHNVLARHPKRAKALKSEWDRWNAQQIAPLWDWTPIDNYPIAHPESS